LSFEFEAAPSCGFGGDGCASCLWRGLRRRGVREPVFTQDIPERPLSLAFARSRQFCSRDKRVFGIGSETAVKMQ
jgi:hypothetical protein